MKFKVGDKVRIIADTSLSKAKSIHIGECHTISEYFDSKKSFYRRDTYEFDGICYSWFDDELELVKSKFNHKNYPGKYVMHVNTAEQAFIFVNYMIREMDGYWPYSFFNKYTSDICYNFNDDTYSCTDFYKRNAYTILEFEDFDWSYFTMEKKFTKADLRNGDVVEFRNADGCGIAIPDVNCIAFKNGQLDMDLLSDDMKHNRNHDYDIMAIRRPSNHEGCSFCAFDMFKIKYGYLVYERKEVEEMTLEEVCKALG